MLKLKWIVPVATLGLLIGAAVVVPARADDAPTTMPTTAPAATITVTVTDGQNNPVSGATVSLFPAKGAKKHAAPAGGADATGGAAAGGRQKPAALTSAQTDDKGVAVLNVADLGKYRVVAMLKGVGRGTANVSIESDGQAATAAITLEAKGGKQKPANGTANGNTSTNGNANAN